MTTKDRFTLDAESARLECVGAMADLARDRALRSSAVSDAHSADSLFEIADEADWKGLFSEADGLPWTARIHRAKVIETEARLGALIEEYGGLLGPMPPPA